MRPFFFGGVYVNKIQKLITTTRTLLNNPMVVFIIFCQMFAQFRVTSEYLKYNGVMAAIFMSFALCLAHVIPTYAAYVVGDGSGLARAPGLKSKIEFVLLGGILALILSLTFTYCVLGVLCQPLLPIIVNPSIVSAGVAGLIAAAYGSLLDVACVFVILAQGGTGDE